MHVKWLKYLIVDVGGCSIVDASKTPIVKWWGGGCCKQNADESEAALILEMFCLDKWINLLIAIVEMFCLE